MIGATTVWKKGDRVQISEEIRPGIGEVPKAGTPGTVERQLEDGTVLVLLGDGRRALLGPLEIKPLAN
jgi:hypothetical protein